MVFGLSFLSETKSFGVSMQIYLHLELKTKLFCVYISKFKKNNIIIIFQLSNKNRCR